MSNISHMKKVFIGFLILFYGCYNSTPKKGTVDDVNGGSQPSYNDMFEVSTMNSLLYRCKACSKEVTNRWHHYHSHTPQRSFCPYCPATYSRIDTLRSHMRAKHQFFKHAFVLMPTPLCIASYCRICRTQGLD